jgi:hypothetical protein
MSYLARWFLVVVLGFTGGAKLCLVGLTTESLRRSGFLPEEWPSLIAWVLPFIEIGVAFLLANHRTLGFGAWSVFFLSLVFSGLHGYTLAYGIVLPCTCVGSLTISYTSRATDAALLVLSLSLVAASCLLLFQKPNRRRMRPDAPSGIERD